MKVVSKHTETTADKGARRGVKKKRKRKKKEKIANESCYIDQRRAERMEDQKVEYDQCTTGRGLAIFSHTRTHNWITKITDFALNEAQNVQCRASLLIKYYTLLWHSNYKPEPEETEVLLECKKNMASLQGLASMIGLGLGAIICTYKMLPPPSSLLLLACWEFVVANIMQLPPAVL